MTRPSFRNRRRFSLTTVLWVNAVLLAGILGSLLTRQSMMPSAMAQQLNNIGGGGGVYVIPAQFGPQQWGCYLIDIDQQTLVAYEYLGGEKRLTFVAARSFKYDRRMGNYSTKPSPAEMQHLLEGEAGTQRHESVIPAPAPAPVPVPPAVEGGKGPDQTPPPEPH